MFPVALLLLLAAGSCVKSETLTQPASVTVQPGQRLTITCRVSYSVSGYWTAWIRQPAGKGLEWIGMKLTGTSYYKDSLKNKFSIDVDSSSNTVTLNGNNMQPDDTAVYYCTRDPDGWVVGPFDYWGSGTEVTVQDTATSPTLFPLVQCQPGTDDTITVGCLAHNFSPRHITFQWTDASGVTLTSEQYPPAEANNKYTGASLINVLKSDWESRKSFTCSITHDGSRETLQVQKPLEVKVTLLSAPSEDTQALICTVEDSLNGRLELFKWKKNGGEIQGHIQSPIQQVGQLYSAVSVLKVSNTDWDTKAVYTCEATYKGRTHVRKISKALITMTLKPPSPKRIFSNNQAELDCVITGPDRDILEQTEITWQINGRYVTSNATHKNQRDGSQHSKVSTMILPLSEWLGVENVRCSAVRESMTPVVQDLTVRKADRSRATVSVHVLPEEDISHRDSDEVTMMCLVSSPVLEDYYIAWSQYMGEESGNYDDGVDFPPVKTRNGYSAASVYSTSKRNWQEKMFNCNVWPAGSNEAMKPRGVSKFLDFPSESELSFALSCEDAASEEDEFSSLSSTTFSFIFLFISSLLYNVIFSLLQMKRHKE